jgi:hypothetical protein
VENTRRKRGENAQKRNKRFYLFLLRINREGRRIAPEMVCSII